MGSAKEPQYLSIQTQEELELGCARLAADRPLAIDTEFVGEKYFIPKLELLQVSDGAEILLIDTGTIADLRPVARLIGDNAHPKIFHAAGQDIEILDRELGARPAPVFDTQIAASLLGYGAQISLANLIKAVLGIDVSSKHSTSDWSHRPLSREQLLYAATDVQYLHALHGHLLDELSKRGRLAWYEDEQTMRLEQIVAVGGHPGEELYRRVKDWMSLSPKELAILRELAIWREETARTRNLPRRTVMTDEGLIELTRFQPETREKAMKLRRINPSQLGKWFDEVREVIARGRAVPREQWPRKPAAERPDIPTGLVELCQALLRTEAERQDIAATVLATTDDIQQVVMRRGDLTESFCPLLRGWRREVAGQKVIDLLQGRLTVTVSADGSLRFEKNSNR